MWIMYFLRPVRFLAKAFTAESTSKQMAWGFAIGLLVGLVPKGNLLAITLMTVLCMLRINLAAGMMSAFAFSWIGVLLDPLTHRLGLALLTVESLRPMWVSLMDTPLMPWSGLNNTVVLGSFVAGLLLLLPARRLSEPIFDKYAPLFTARLKRLRLVQVLWGAEWAEKLGQAA